MAKGEYNKKASIEYFIDASNVRTLTDSELKAAQSILTKQLLDIKGQLDEAEADGILDRSAWARGAKGASRHKNWQQNLVSQELERRKRRDKGTGSGTFEATFVAIARGLLPPEVVTRLVGLTHSKIREELAEVITPESLGEDAGTGEVPGVFYTGSKVSKLTSVEQSERAEEEEDATDDFVVDDSWDDWESGGSNDD